MNSGNLGMTNPNTTSSGHDETTATSTTPTEGSEGVVMVVDDDEAFAETMGLHLRENWDVVYAHDGDEAVEKYGPHVDVVLLDRRMPTMPGDEALPELREQDGETAIAMMTAVDPDWDIVDMDIDMYLTKPIDTRTIEETVGNLYDRAQYARELRGLFSLSSKIAALEERYPDDVLQNEERYQRLVSEQKRLREESRGHMDDLSAEEFKRLTQVFDST